MARATSMAATAPPLISLVVNPYSSTVVLDDEAASTKNGIQHRPIVTTRMTTSIRLPPMRLPGDASTALEGSPMPYWYGAAGGWGEPYWGVPYWGVPY